jgi:hypothetical protein
MIELTKQESETYLIILKSGNMEKMFDYGVAIGVYRQSKKSLELLLESIKVKKI